MDFFLGIDVGNTHTVIGLFTKKRLFKSWRISTNKHSTHLEIAAVVDFLLRHEEITFKNIRHGIISSVVPQVDNQWADFFKNFVGLKPINAHQEALKTIKINYPRPHEIGTDRLVNSIAAYHLVKGACIVIDYGTATTFDCISENGEYLGGAIAPGLLMSLNALFSGTSKLPLVRPDFTGIEPIGKSTEDAIRSGLFYGFLGLTENILNALKSSMSKDVTVIGTGGLSQLFVKKTRLIEKLEPNLTLLGLKILLISSLKN